MNNGDGQRFFKVGTLIDIMKNLGPNQKQGINCRPFYVISLNERKSKLQQKIYIRKHTDNLSMIPIFLSNLCLACSGTPLLWNELVCRFGVEVGEEHDHHLEMKKQKWSLKS